MRLWTHLALCASLAVLPTAASAQDNSTDEPTTANPGKVPVGPRVTLPGANGGVRPPIAPLRPPAPQDADEEDDGGTGGGGGSTSTAPSSGSSSSRTSGGEDGASGADASSGDRARPPQLSGARKVTLDMLNTNVYDLVKFYAELTGRNAIIGDPKELRGAEVSIISNQAVGAAEAEQAIVSALEVAGYTLVILGQTVKVVKTDQAASSPIGIGEGDSIPYSDKYVTQIIPLKNVSVADVSQVINALVGPQAKVLAYAPSNTLIITDSANNLRKVYRILENLDIAAPKSRLEIIQLQYAESSELVGIIQDLYGVGEEAKAASSSSSSSSRRTTTSRRTPKRDETPTADAVTAGTEAKYINKVMADERTNSIIVLANDEGMAAVYDLIGRLDVDVSLSSRSQIHVVKLEHAKAEDVANVLANLSDGGSSSTPTSRTSSRTNTRAPTPTKGKTDAEDSPMGVLAAFDSGMRITHDETTNSLVIIASQDDFEVVKQVIDALDARRRQVFVDAVVLELSSDDSFDLGVAYHGPLVGQNDNITGIAGGQFGTSSLGLSQDLLSGLALGVYGQTVEVPFADGTMVPVPAFGIVLNALKSNSAVNIVSNPNLMTLDNEEAKIVVGRKIPFPTSSGLNSLGSPVISYQREDVAITLNITPRINSEDFVTLELQLEVSEVEEDDSGLDPSQAGFITSKREVETVALVRDNQTVVLGGLVGTTDTEVETKVPILGDLPLIGALFRGKRDSSRKTNLMVFLTPHIVDDDDDFVEVMRVKEAQRQEFLRRFYGRSRDQQMEEIASLLKFSMNQVDEPSFYRGSSHVSESVQLDGEPLSDEARAAIAEELEAMDSQPGESAGTLPPSAGSIELSRPEGESDDGLFDAPAEGADEAAPADGGGQ